MLLLYIGTCTVGAQPFCTAYMRKLLMTPTACDLAVSCSEAALLHGATHCLSHWRTATSAVPGQGWQEAFCYCFPADAATPTSGSALHPPVSQEEVLC